MLKKVVGLFALSLTPVIAMAGTVAANHSGSAAGTVGVAVSGKGHCIYASRVVLPGGVIIHKNKQGKPEWKQVCVLTPAGWGKFSAPVRIHGKPSALYANYTISLGSKVVYSGKVHLNSASAPEHFTVTVTKAGKVVAGGFSGVTLPGTPMSNSDVTQISYVSGASSEDNSRTVKLHTATLTYGKTFILIADKNNVVQVIGDISKLTSLKAHHAHGLVVQTPTFMETQANQTVVLAPGQSTVFSMGKYQVTVARN
ncbi:MAG: hypothetical protein ACYCS8_05275 [Acidithiobacillus sp.]